MQKLHQALVIQQQVAIATPRNPVQRCDQRDEIRLASTSAGRPQRCQDCSCAFLTRIARRGAEAGAGAGNCRKTWAGTWRRSRRESESKAWRRCLRSTVGKGELAFVCLLRRQYIGRSLRWLPMVVGGGAPASTSIGCSTLWRAAAAANLQGAPRRCRRFSLSPLHHMPLP